MRKVLYSLPVMLLLIIAFSLPVFAADTVNAYFNKVEGYIYNHDGFLVAKTWEMYDNSANKPDTTLIRCLFGVQNERFTGYRIKLISNAFVRVESGYYFTYSLTIKETSAIYSDFDPKAYVVAEDDSVYNLNVSWSPEYSGTSNSVTITVGGRVGDGYPLRFGVLYLDFPGIYSSGSGTSSYSLVCSNTFTISKTPEQLRHDELLGTIEESTDKLLEEDFGYTTPDVEVGVTGDISDTNTFIGGITDGINTLYDEIGAGFEMFFFENPVMDTLWCWFGTDRLFIYTVVFSSMTFLFLRKLVK